jgi:hypothetical protein
VSPSRTGVVTSDDTAAPQRFVSHYAAFAWAFVVAESQETGGPDLPSAEEHQVSENTQHQHGHDHREQVFRIKQSGRWEHAQWDGAMTATMLMERKRVATGGAGF